MKDPKEIEKEKSKKYNNKEIIALSDFEHCLTRPTMYVGSVEKSDERVQIIEGGKIVEKTKTISVGFYKMLNEIVDNAFDEAKRMAGKMPTIIVKINSKTNEVTVIDTGDGFINAEKINQKTGSSNVETAMTMLRAGSNFYNDSASDALIGTNGVGAALVNMLSDSFEITTTNSEVTYQIGWDRFVKKQEECASRKSNPLGTNVKYIPRKDIFKSCKWDKEYLHSMFIFRQYLKNRDSIISNLSLEFYFDDEKLNLDIDFLPENAILLTTKLGIFAAWINFESSASVSFINGANCVGIHQKIVTDWMNDIFNYPQAYRFFETLLILNLPPKLVRFADQNKTRYAANRNDIQELLEKNFYKSLRQQLPKSEFFHLVKKAIEEHTKSAELKNIKSKKKAATKKISDKYFPPSQSKGTLFIVEGSCIHEDTTICIWRDGEPLYLPIKDVIAGDEVITHENRFRKIVIVQKKLKETTKIVLKTGETLIQSPAHKYYVYDKEKKTFYFLRSDLIDKEKHCLVKNRLRDFIGTIEVIEKYVQEGKYSHCFLLENGELHENTANHSYAVFSNTSQTFEMRSARDINVGDLIAIFGEI